MAKSWWNLTWICWKSLKLTEIWISNWTGDFCAAMEFSKKFKVLLGFDVVRLGSLNQRQLENFFQTQKFEIYKQNFHFFSPRMDRSLHWPRRIWISNWIFGAEKSFPEVWKCGILNLLWKELSNGVGIIQIGRKLPDSDFQQNPVASPTKWKHRKTPVPLGNHAKWKF